MSTGRPIGPNGSSAGPADRRSCGAASTAGTIRSPSRCLDGLDGASFTTEIFIDEKPPYYSFAGERTRMTGAEVVAAFGGEAEE